MASNEPCPDEQLAPAPAPGPIDDQERIIRLIKLQVHVAGDDASGYKLVPGHWSKSDLKGKQGDSASVLRECTPPTDVVKRAHAYDATQATSADPTIAVAVTADVRGLVDDAQHREVCVYAEPIVDRHGPCPTHGGIRRSTVENTYQRTAFLDLARKLCDKFSIQSLADLAGASGISP